MFNNNISWKKKAVYTIIIIALVITQGYLLVGFEINAWNSVISLGTQIFYVEQPTSQLQFKHQSSVQNYIRWYFGKDAKLAESIFKAESGLRCDSISQTGDYGVAQINHKAHPQYTVAQLLDCQTNIKIASQIYKQQGNFTAWTTYRTGAYKQFIAYAN